MTEAHKLNCEAVETDCQFIIQSENGGEALELAKTTRKRFSERSSPTRNSGRNICKSSNEGARMAKTLDVDKLEREIKEVYRDVARTPDEEFHFEMGRPSQNVSAIPQRTSTAFHRRSSTPSQGWISEENTSDGKAWQFTAFYPKSDSNRIAGANIAAINAY